MPKWWNTGIHFQTNCLFIFSSHHSVVHLLLLIRPVTIRIKSFKSLSIFKKGDNGSTKNYRPISIICFISTFDITCRHQFCFRSGLNMSDAILEYLDCAYDTINNSKLFLTKFLDFSRALDTARRFPCDTVSKEILLNYSITVLETLQISDFNHI